MLHRSDPDAIRAEQRRIIAENMSEGEFQALILEYAKAHGWMASHSRPARRGDGSWNTPVAGDVGAPDLLLARGGTVYLWELKTERGRYRDGQTAWLAAIGPVIGATYRPSDLDRIYELLS